MLRKITIFIGSILVSLAAGAIGSLATIPNIPSWYAGLDKPTLNPPNFVFGPVWTTLYVLMGVALALVIIKSAKNKTSAYVWFGVQLALNALWSIVFFGLHQPWIGVVVILGLLVSLVMTIVKFRRITSVAMWLLVPYVAWVCFATYLNISIAILN